MLKVGVIGFGKMGMLHGALLNSTQQYTIAAICDKSLTMRVGFKKLYKNVHVYSDVSKMFKKEKLDVVIVTTPTFNHKDSVVAALQHGCAVFVEKPLAITSAQAQEIYKVANDLKLPVQVGFCNRFAPSIFKGRQMLHEKAIGAIKKVSGQMFIGDVFEKHMGWRYKKALSGGGVLMDFGIHLIDLLIWFFGDIYKVSAQSRMLYSLEVEDEVDANIVFTNGVIAECSTSWSKQEYRKSYSRIVILGTEGSLEITDQTLKRFDIHGDLLEDYTYPDLYDGCFMDIGGILFSKQMEDFLKLIDHKETYGCTPKEAIYVQRVIESIYKSAERNADVIIEVQNAN